LRDLPCVLFPPAHTRRISPDTRHVGADTNGQGRAVFGADDLDFHTVRRWNAVDIVGVARADAQVLVDGRPALRDGPRFLYSLPLAEGSPAHVTNITLLARITGEDEEWVARRSVALRIPACPEEIGTALAGAVVSDSLAEYLFDARNRLRRVTDKVAAPRLRAVYDYYPDGRRARKVVSLWTNQQWVAAYTNQYLYDRWNLVREVVADSGTVTTRDYTWGLDLAGLQSGTWEQESGGIGGLLAVTEVSGTATNILLPISDHIGTVHSLVAAMTNSVALAQPAVVAEYDYAPYGQLLSADGPLVGSCPFGFQSKYYDPEIGFWYFGHRYYDAKSCKWLTADPLGEAGGLNLTAFCGGDPVNQVDPFGLWTWDNYWVEPLFSSTFWMGCGDTTGEMVVRTVAGIGEAGLIGSDIMGYGAAAACGYGEAYQGYSRLFQTLYNNPAVMGSEDEVRRNILAGTGKEIVNIASLGFYGMAESHGQAWATGDWDAAQDRSLQAVLLAYGAKSMQARGINPYRAYTPNQYGRAITLPIRTVPAKTTTRIGYHATHSQYAKSIRATGFRAGSSPGRLGSGGVYVNNTRAGAIAEFAYRNPGVTPQVLRVRYQPGVEAITDVAPRGYVDHIPLNVDSITAPSVRLPSSQNTIIFDISTIEILP
jgi:RHS repeat-associated protein